jgi:hypothetical protein
MNVTTQQLQKKFKHASDFGVTGTATAPNLAAFERALQNHVASGDTVHVDGSFRGQAAILHVDPNTSLAVITDKDANFLSGWRLSAQQLEYALREGKLGGG